MEKVVVNEKVSEKIRKGYLIITKKDFQINKEGFFEIYDKNNNFLCLANINPKSEIILRVISYEKDFCPKEFFYKRLKKAYKFRKRIYKDSFRWVYSEADFLSGLIIDKFKDIVVIQNSNPLFDKYLDIIAECILEIDNKIEAIYFKGEFRSRKNEGLEIYNKFLYGNKEETIIEEGDAKFIVNVVKGQKTGFFLDQRENRILFGKLAYGKVLDVFSYTGGFGIHAALNPEVNEVIFIEKDKKAIEILKRNVELNDIKDKVKIVKADAFKYLKNINEKFDVVNLDPPSLVHSGIKKSKGIKGLYIINCFAAKLSKDILVTSDCSYHIKEKEFFEVILKAAENKFNIIWKGYQALDHPVHPLHKELKYLKTLFLSKNYLE